MDVHAVWGWSSVVPVCFAYDEFTRPRKRPSPGDTPWRLRWHNSKREFIARAALLRSALQVHADGDAIVMPREVIMRSVFIAVVCVLCATLPSLAAQARIVTCTATMGFHCTPDTGCTDDATYITEYRVDPEAGTVDELTVQHTIRDSEPRPGSTSYTIARSSPATAISERSLIAVGFPGSAAVETILIGERSYLSSSVSSAGTRIFSMVGTCTGF